MPMNQKLAKEFYTINDVAQLFGVTRTTVYDWMNSGQLPYVIVGGRRRITREALQAFIRPGEPSEQDAEEKLVPGAGLGLGNRTSNRAAVFGTAPAL
jgi:excisionase family DNA binding protein